MDLTYRDQDTPVVTFSTDWQNQRQKVEIEVLKTEKDSDRAVPGSPPWGKCRSLTSRPKIWEG